MLASLFKRLLIQEDRLKTIVLTAGAGLVSKVVNFAMIFAVVPLTLPALGPDRFGVLMTILGYGALFAFLDLGLGSALIRESAKFKVLGNSVATADMLGSALFMLLGLGLVFSAVMLVAAFAVPIGAIFYRLPFTYHEETRSALIGFALVFSIALPLQGLQKIYLGLQCGYITHLVSAILSLIALATLYHFRQSNLTIQQILLVTYGLPALAPIVYLPWFLRDRLASYSFRLRAFRLNTIVLFRSGSLFLVLQLGYVLGWSIDGSLTSATLGASAAGALAIVQRLFQLVSVPLNLINAPLWPAYSDAIARDDVAFIKLTLKRSMSLTAIAAVFAVFAIMIFRNEIVSVWFGRHLDISATLILLAGLMVALESTGNCFAMYLNGLHILRPQIIVALTFILLSVPIKYIMINRFGIEGVVAATIVCYIICVIIPYSTVFRPSIFLPINGNNNRA